MIQANPLRRSNPEASAHRTTCPGVTPPPGLKPPSDEVLRRSREAQSSQRHRDLSSLERKWCRENLTLRAYYDAFIEPEHRAKLERGQIAAGTLQKYRQALTRWETFTRPDDWPKGKKAPTWPGLTIGAVREPYLEEFFRRCEVDGGLSRPTVRSTWHHLRVFFNHAHERRILRRRLRPKSPKPKTRTPATSSPEIFTNEQLVAAYHAFADRPSLQVAFVLGLACGARPSDLFLLRWSDVRLDERAGPMLYFTARKTGKDHGIPLAAHVVSHLQRLERAGEFLFPGLSEPHYRDPEKSRTARARTAETKLRLKAVGISFAKPWHACRRTCNDLLENHRTGAGQFVLGHALTLNSESYRAPDRLVREAVESLAWPSCFLRIVSETSAA